MLIDCAACNGTGDVRIPDPTGDDVGDLAICSDCGGTGKAGPRRPVDMFRQYPVADDGDRSDPWVAS